MGTPTEEAWAQNQGSLSRAMVAATCGLRKDQSAGVQCLRSDTLCDSTKVRLAMVQGLHLAHICD